MGPVTVISAVQNTEVSCLHEASMAMFLCGLHASRYRKGRVDKLKIARSALYGETVALRQIWSFLNRIPLFDFNCLMHKQVPINPDMGLAAVDTKIVSILSLCRIKPAPIQCLSMYARWKKWKKRLFKALARDMPYATDHDRRTQKYLQQCAKSGIPPPTPLAFGWCHDETISPDICFSVPSQESHDMGSDISAVAYKQSGYPDCSLIFGDTPLTSGAYFWEVYVAAAGDETWIGVATAEARDQLIQNRYKRTDTMDTPGVIALYDCQRRGRFPALHYRGGTGTKYIHAPGSFAHQTVGVFLDLDAQRLCFIVSGEIVVMVDKIHTGPLYPVCHMDDGGDTYVLTRAFRVRPRIVLWPKPAVSDD